MVKVAGGVLSWFGIGAAALSIWVAYKALSLPGRVDTFILALIGASAVLAVFCLTVGWRLYLNRPNRHGSALGPLGWRIVGTVLGIAGCALLGLMAARSDAPVDVLSALFVSAVGCLVFCYWCFLLARRIRHG